MAKKKSGASRGSSSGGGGKLGVLLATGLAVAGGGYFAGKNSETIEQGATALLARIKPDASAPTPATKPAQEPKRAEAPTHAVKPADKAELSRMLKGADAKPAVPTPPAKPDMSKPEMAKADAAKDEAETPRAKAPEQPAPLAFSLVDRDVAAGEDGERVTLSLNFENLAGKPIRAFEGVVKVSDGQDNHLYSSKISVSALIAENGSLHWEQHVEAKKLDEKARRLVSEDKGNLKAVFLLKRIFFVDGSVQKYAMPPKAAQAG